MKRLIASCAATTLLVLAVANTAAAFDSWSFVMLGDTRDADDTSTGISAYLQIIAQKIATLNPKLVIVAGDLCNGNALKTNSPLYPKDGNFTNAAAKATYDQFFANWKAAMQPIFNYSAGTGIPIYTVRGNHESNDTERAPIDVLTQAYQQAFSSYVPTNGPNNGLTDDERGFSWSFTSNNVTFVAADQYFRYDPTHAGGTMPYSGYHYLDREWVTQQFEQASSPYKIFIVHEPLFQTVGNSSANPDNEDAQHFFGSDAAALQTRKQFWNDLGDAGVQMYLAGHLHLETIAATTNDHEHSIIQVMAGNGGAPAQDYIDKPERGVTTLYNNGNTLVDSNGTVSVKGNFGFALATVQDTQMTIHYHSLDPITTNWTVAGYVTVITSATSRPTIGMPFDPRTGTFTYTRPDPAGTRLNYSVEKSPDLSTWNVDAAANQTITTVTNNLQTVQVTLSGTKPLTGPRLFIRIAVQ
jgi:hypothetical protein